MEMKTTLSQGFFERYCPDPYSLYDLPELYVEFNARYFNGELPLARTRVVKQRDGGIGLVPLDIIWEGRYRRTYGTYAPSKVRGHGKIRIARHCVKTPHQVQSTLLHEMLHKWLDLKGLDDGIKGHGPNFVSHAKDINDKCRDAGVAYRINFHDEEITLEEPVAYCDLLKTTIHCGRDLDVAVRMQSILKAAFDTNYEYTV
jgi:hypothetical protein